MPLPYASPPGWRIERADPGAPGPLALLRAHLDLMRAITPEGSVHALDLDALRGPDIIFLALAEGEETIGMGALRRLPDGAGHGEIKSMHTASAHRGRGVARALLARIMDEAHTADMTRLSLETGSTEHFAAPRALYAAHGFVPSGPFGHYGPDPHSHFMTRTLHGAWSARAFPAPPPLIPPRAPRR